MSKTILAVVLVTIVALSGSQASAQQAANPCDQAVTQMDMNGCSADQYKKAHARLNAVYGAVLKWLKSFEV